MKRLHMQRPEAAARLRQLDRLSRTRALSDAESRALERLLANDYHRRLRCDQPIPRGAA